MAASRRKIAIVTGTRAEYGLLSPLIREIAGDDGLDLQLVVTGMHLAPQFGLTWREIADDGVPIAEKVEILLASDTPVGIAKSIGVAIMGFAEAFARLGPDILVVLGDRFEVLAAASAALVARIPIAHIHGGESTEGLIDEAIRHAVTKMAAIHFAAAEPYRRRIIQMGEDPARIHCFGAPALDVIRTLTLIDRDALARELDLALDAPVFAVTFHPVTLERETSAGQFRALLDALDAFPEARIVLTKPNADTDGQAITAMVDDYARANHGRVAAFASLGQKRYLSLLKHADAVIGNSSSGLIEAPQFETPTVNIGDRQRGRLAPASVIHCAPRTDEIIAAIRRALTQEFRQSLSHLDNPYGDGTAAPRMKQVLKEIKLGEALIKKTFHNLTGAEGCGPS